MKNTLISLSVGLALFMTAALPGLASAATLSTNQVQAVISLLQAFGVDSSTIANVQQTLSGVQTTPPSTASTTALTAQAIGLLHLGDKGDSVKYLQTLLAADPSIYPSGVTSGYFGALTQAALKLYQQKHGLAQVGSVDSQTLKDLEGDLANNPLGTEGGNASSMVSVGNRHICAIVPPGHLIAPGWLKKHGTSPAIPTCQTLPPGIAGQLGSTILGVVTVTAPVISGVTVSNIASTSASVSWNTNELATGKVYFGTTTPLNLGTATNVVSTSLTSAHSFSLMGLATSTAYFYVVESKDAANNTATTSTASFTTLAL